MPDETETLAVERQLKNRTDQDRTKVFMAIRSFVIFVIIVIVISLMGRALDDLIPSSSRGCETAKSLCWRRP